MGRARITVLGIFAADVTSRVARLPRWQETLVGMGAMLGPGGKGSNQAIAAARLGAEVSFIAKLGEDEFGAMARRLYRLEGIDSTHVRASATEPTGMAMILIDAADGANAIVVNPGAGVGLSDAEIDAAQPAIVSADVFLTSLEVSVRQVARAAGHARRGRVPIVLNPAPALPVGRDLLAAVDYLTPNEVEAAALAGFPIADLEAAAQAAERLRERGARTVILTLGAKGAYLRSDEVAQHVPAFPVSPVLDTTGAGDAFNGGFAVALAEGRPLLEAARFGAAVAALSVQARGAGAAMPPRAAVDALMGRST